MTKTQLKGTPPVSATTCAWGNGAEVVASGGQSTPRWPLRARDTQPGVKLAGGNARSAVNYLHGWRNWKNPTFRSLPTNYSKTPTITLGFLQNFFISFITSLSLFTVCEWGHLTPNRRFITQNRARSQMALTRQQRYIGQSANITTPSTGSPGWEALLSVNNN